MTKSKIPLTAGKLFILVILLLVSIPTFSQSVDTALIRRDDGQVLNSTWDRDAITVARVFYSEPRKDNRLSESIQWITYWWSATKLDWFVRQPGIYAANTVIFTVASDSDVVIDWEGFDSLKSENGESSIPIWYAINFSAPYPPPLDDPCWVLAGELNPEAENDTLFDSPELEVGLQFKRWYKIEVSQSPQSACEYIDSATVGFLTYGHCSSLCSVSVRASVAQWTNLEPSPFTIDYPQKDKVLSEEVEVFWWDGMAWESQGIGNPSARARAYLSLPQQYQSPLCGDVNKDGVINVTDVVYLINYLFIDGPAPVPIQAGDVNCDGTINASDVVYLINYLFINGPPPCR